MEILIEHNSTIKVKRVKLDNGEEWDLIGECSRCGDCCENINVDSLPILQPAINGKCKFMYYEIVNGERLCSCKAQRFKPDDCSLYPYDPHNKLYENCSYEWKRVK